MTIKMDPGNDYPEIPKLPCVKTPDGSWGIWCQYCKKHHIHGSGEFPPRLGHRYGHCDKDTPYRISGYFMVEDHGIQR